MLIAIRKPKRSTSYSTSSFEARELKRIANLKLIPHEAFNNTSASQPLSFDESSTYMVHSSISSGSELVGGVIPSIKSTTACPLILVWGSSVISYSLSSNAYLINLPDVSGLWKTGQRGKLVNTITKWSWKYGWNRWAEVTKDRASFSMVRYQVSTSVMALLVY